MQKTAVITGITGQDGSYLAEFLLSKDYRVFGLERRNSTKNRQNIGHLLGRVTLVSGDLTDSSSLVSMISEVCPEEVYNRGAQSFVGESWRQPVLTQVVTGLGPVRLLEAIRQIDRATGRRTKFYQASSSEMFGKVTETPQRETTRFYPRSPYGIAKLCGHWSTVNARESHDMFAVSGILFNHESPRRGIEFVTRKITDAAARIKLGLANELVLGNTAACRDWGYAGDYVQAMWLMLQQEKPDDFVIATGKTHSVQEFIEEAFNHLGLNYAKYLKTSDEFRRPADVELLIGDPSKAKEKLGWEPKVGFKELVKMMVDSDMKLLSGEK